MALSVVSPGDLGRPKGATVTACKTPQLLGFRLARPLAHYEGREMRSLRRTTPAVATRVRPASLEIAVPPTRWESEPLPPTLSAPGRCVPLGLPLLFAPRVNLPPRISTCGSLSRAGSVKRLNMAWDSLTVPLRPRKEVPWSS